MRLLEIEINTLDYCISIMDNRHNTYYNKYTKKYFYLTNKSIKSNQFLWTNQQKLYTE